jgi:hypothetical protein
MDDEDQPGKPKKRKGAVIAANKSHLKPVAFVQRTLQLVDRAVPASNVLMLSDSTDLTARAGVASVRVAKGSAAFVVNNGSDVTVLSLHDDSAGAVTVTVGERKVVLRAGEQLVVRSSDSILLPQVAIRGGREHVLGDGNRVFVSEFSIPSAISSIRALRSMSSSENRIERATYGKIMKNAAALHMLMLKKGPYKVDRERTHPACS